MSIWPSTQARRILRALSQIGWIETSRAKSGSHRQLSREGWPDFTWAFHDGDEVGPAMLARIAKNTGLTPKDL